MFKSSHNLAFETAHWNSPFNDEGIQMFRVGTIEGLWRSTDKSYDIIAILNKDPGNGHLNDLFEWFEQSCKRDKKYLRVLEIMSDEFFIHLTTKRGFVGNHKVLKKSF